MNFYNQLITPVLRREFQVFKINCLRNGLQTGESVAQAAECVKENQFCLRLNPSLQAGYTFGLT